MDWDTNVITNFDWYHPLHAHRHTEDEVRRVVRGERPRDRALRRRRERDFRAWQKAKQRGGVTTADRVFSTKERA